MHRTLIIALAASLISPALAQVQQRHVSEIKAESQDIRVVRTVQTINGIDIFGSEGKQIIEGQQVVSDLSRQVVAVGAVAPAHKQEFDENGFRASGDYAGEDIVYRQFVYYKENDNLVPAIRLQLFDGAYTRTVVIEQDTHRVLLDRDETSHAHCNSGNCGMQSDHFSLRKYPFFEIQEATFQFFPDDNPAPASPHPTGMPDGFQAPYLNHEFIDNRRSFASPMGWLTLDGPFETVGNNIIAETEGGNANQYDDGPVAGTGIGDSLVRFSPYYRLDYDWNSADFLTLQAAAVNSFAHGNLLHDWYYRFGFDEESGNFQNDNFDRGGVGGDPMLIVAYYHPLFANNAFYSGTEIDGTPGVIYMLRFASTQQGNDRHSGFDSRLLAHEYQHGVTRRLIGSLSFDPARALNEGWSDFASFMYTLEPFNDVRNATVAIADWLTYQFNGRPAYDDNYYFGIRHMPITWDFARNPMTYADTDIYQWHIEEGTPRSTLPLYDSPHTFGQLWTLALWDNFVLYNDMYPFERSKMLSMRLTLEGQRLTPPEPTFVEARDAYVAADKHLFDGRHRVAIWRAFARRGLGVDAVSPDRRTLEGAVESFDEPDWGDFNQDGIKDALDVNLFINAFVTENPTADLNWDGFFDMSDISEFITLYLG